MDGTTHESTRRPRSQTPSKGPCVRGPDEEVGRDQDGRRDHPQGPLTSGGRVSVGSILPRVVKDRVAIPGTLDTKVAGSTHSDIVGPGRRRRETTGTTPPQVFRGIYNRIGGRSRHQRWASGEEGPWYGV